MTARSKLLFICSHLVGRLRATNALARRLIADGHYVRLAAPALALGHLHTYPDYAIELDDFNLGGVHGGENTALTDFLPAARKARLSQLAQSLNIAQVEDLIRTERPDLVVIDFEMHPHIIAALGLSAPVVLLTDLFVTQPGSDAPPLHELLRPGATKAGHIRWAWLKLWMKSRKAQARKWRRARGSDYRSLLFFMARERGISLKDHTTRWWWQVPFAWRSLPLIVLQSPALDFPIDYDAQLVHVGPMLPALLPPKKSEETVLDIARQARENSKRVVYVAFGKSFKADQKVIRKVWRALDGLPDVVAIQSAGGRPDIAAAEAPDNVRLVDWAPQSQLLHLCDAAVIHGGVNTVLECIASETPMLSIPRGVDQPGNTARLVYHGLGISGTNMSGAEELRVSLRKLLDEPCYRDRCKDMHIALKRHETEKSAEQAFRSLLSGQGRKAER